MRLHLNRGMTWLTIMSEIWFREGYFGSRWIEWQKDVRKENTEGTLCESQKESQRAGSNSGAGNEEEMTGWAKARDEPEIQTENSPEPRDCGSWVVDRTAKGHRLGGDPVLEECLHLKSLKMEEEPKKWRWADMTGRKLSQKLRRDTVSKQRSQQSRRHRKARQSAPEDDIWFIDEEFASDHSDTDFSINVKMEARLQRHEWWEWGSGGTEECLRERRLYRQKRQTMEKTKLENRQKT